MEKNQVIIGCARGLSQYYQDGTERMEIHINKKYENYFPNVYSKAFPIDVTIDNKKYTFFFRKTEKCEYLWFCPYVYYKNKKMRLSDLLIQNNISKNDKLKIKKIQHLILNNNFRLFP